MSEHEEFKFHALNLGLDILMSDFEDYLRDESRFTGSACGLIRAQTDKDVANSLMLANRHNVPLTVVSGKTSITGASAPQSGFILSVRGLDALDEKNVNSVGVGVILKEYKKVVEQKGYFYPPDPTSEDSCTLGGTIACNASGSLSYLYGPTRDYINGLTVVLPNGTFLDIERGGHFSDRGGFRVSPRELNGNLSEELFIPAPRIPQCPWDEVKNAAGLFSNEPMDLIDLFIGGEGILGVVVSARTRVIKKRPPYFALMIFVSSRYATVRLVQTLDKIRRLFHSETVDGFRGSGQKAAVSKEPYSNGLEKFSIICPSCMEWFGSSTSGLLDGVHSEKLTKFYGALYIEQDYRDSDDMFDKLQKWSDMLDYLKSGNNFGAVDIEAATDEKHLRALRRERIQVPERLNERIKPGLRKIGTDLAVPMEKLDLLLSLYDEKLPRELSCIFGHIGNAHLHANILAGDSAQTEQFNELHLQMAKYVCSIGGSVSGEHGIGKLKKKLLKAMIGESGLEEIRKVKSALDPNWILNPGNIIDPY